ncbi:MAG: hypothetical protein KDC44_15375, partial [Phaeodactylibacter sp.]|nr:hypothetical protein [Phaeodactylibacter sp.]
MLRLRILKPLLLLGFFLWNLSLGAQVGINDDGTAPAPSAVLDIKSTDKGLLIPRMTSMQRSDISAPATGLLVFDLDTESFWYHQTGGWVELSLQTPTGMIDGDQDTKIELVEGINDEIVFTLDGLPHLRLIDGRLETINLFRSVFLGGGAGRLDPVNSDLRNVMLGDSTMQRNQTGRFNTAIGYKSLEDNTSGRENVANGFVALPNNTTGERNIGIGDFANYNNKTGSDNICIGRDAGVNFDSLSNAIAIGWNAKAIQNNSMVLGSANDVGIGTNAPEAKLHVVGSMRIADGTQNSGYVFTSDANGLGSWQPNSADNFGN